MFVARDTQAMKKKKEARDARPTVGTLTATNGGTGGGVWRWRGGGRSRWEEGRQRTGATAAMRLGTSDDA